eukprot:6194558-Pleurochrysis_carterae.AAC.1
MLCNRPTARPSSVTFFMVASLLLSTAYDGRQHFKSAEVETDAAEGGDDRAVLTVAVVGNFGNFEGIAEYGSRALLNTLVLASL